jgi:YesN/AraC family two-component response regulator
MKKILVIENEALSRNILIECLSSEGFKVISAEDGKTGITQACEQLPDLILQDVRWPSLAGYDVQGQLRSIQETALIPFLFLINSLETVNHFDSISLKNCLIKPFTIEELLTDITKQLTRSNHALVEPPKNNVIDTLGFRAESSLDTARSTFANHAQLNYVFNFIEANFHRQISLRDVAQAVGYSPAYLTTLVGSQTGQTISRWITERRMEEGCFLLWQSNLSVDHIAEAVGYTNVRNFFRQFRQHYGVTPHIWRKEARRNQCITQDRRQREFEAVEFSS